MGFIYKTNYIFLPVKMESRTAFFGEDVHVDILSQNRSEVVFRPRTNRTYEVPLLRAGRLTNRAKADLNALGDLVLKDVQEEDEGLYVIRDGRNSSRQLVLTVRGGCPASGGKTRFKL